MANGPKSIEADTCRYEIIFRLISSISEQLRLSKRDIHRSLRELDRERGLLENEEQRLVREIRQVVQKGDMTSARLLAKDLVRVKKHQQKFYLMRSQLQAVNLRLQTVKSTQAMSDSMRGVAHVMQRINESLDVPGLHDVMRNFTKESNRLVLTEDIMSDAIDDTMGTEINDEEIEEDVINKVLDEIGVDLATQTHCMFRHSTAHLFPQLLVSSVPATHALPTSAARIPSQQTSMPVGVSMVGSSIAEQQETVPAALSVTPSDLERSLDERLRNLKA